MKNNKSESGQKKITVKDITLIGLMAAMVFVASQLSIPIPTAIGNTRIHLGNVLCLLSGFLLGPVGGGLSAGIGSALYDLTNPAYVTSAPFTFVFKFLMAWVCGILYRLWKNKGKTILYSAVSGTAGAITYVILYLGKSFFESYVFLQMPLEGVLVSLLQKGTVSLVNGIIAVIVSVPLSIAVRPVLNKFNSQTESLGSRRGIRL